MARKTFVELVDDIDGSKADHTVTFSLDGVSYEIDLNDHHAEKIRAEIGGWAGHARRVGGRRSVRAAASPNDTAQIRQWARDNGYDVSDRGRISADVREAYKAAH